MISGEAELDDDEENDESFDEETGEPKAGNGIKKDRDIEMDDSSEEEEDDDDEEEARRVSLSHPVCILIPF